jgi:hypothetical protein
VMDYPSRLRARVWIDACLTVCRAESVAATVLAKGDPDGGAILLKWRRPDGQGSVLAPFTDMDGQRYWTRSTGAEPVAEAECDAYWQRQRARDRDLWVLEIESRDLWHPLGEPVEEVAPTEPSPAEALFKQRR